MENSNPTTKYLLTGKGRGTSSVVKGGSRGLIGSGMKNGDKSVGSKRFDLSNRSLNRGSRKI